MELGSQPLVSVHPPSGDPHRCYGTDLQNCMPIDRLGSRIAFVSGANCERSDVHRAVDALPSFCRGSRLDGADDIHRVCAGDRGDVCSCPASLEARKTIMISCGETDRLTTHSTRAAIACFSSSIIALLLVDLAPPR